MASRIGYLARLPKCLFSARTKPANVSRLHTDLVYNKNVHLSRFRTIHTSVPRNAIPPIVWLVLRPASKLVAMLFGRGFRKWWQSLPPDKRTLFVNAVKSRKYQIGGLCVTSTGLGYYYYISHLEETPITHRKRFVAFTTNQFNEISRQEFKVNVETYKTQILHKKHPAYTRVGKVANRLLNGNKDIAEIYNKEWTITVIDDDTMKNAYVLPTGNIFVFTGMLQLCTNDDQLGIILGHEMAHAIMSHGAEQVSYLHLLDLLVILPVGVIWAIIPSDALALLTQWLFSKVIDLLLHLPFTRELEIEADEVGLKLAAKACFDVREASAFWGRMALLSQVHEQMEEIEWLSTHPSHEYRKENLDDLMANALETREQCSCPSLPRLDPRLSIESLRKDYQQKMSNPENFAMSLKLPIAPATLSNKNVASNLKL